MKNAWLLRCFLTVLVILGAAAVLWPERLHDALVQIVRTAYISLPEPSFTALFVGDIMLDRTVATHARAAGDEALFAGVRELFQGYDLRVGNLEGSITTNPSLSQASSTVLRFTFDPKYAAVLKDAGFDAVSLANNHALDFGKSGYAQTTQYLSGQGISFFGSPLNNENISAALQVNGKTLCLVGFHQLYDPNPSSMLEEIARIRPECSHIVLVAHWGEEYQHEPTQAQRNAAHMFIDAGVDVVIGAHPHIVEPVEIYKNKAIFYSLGNFIFDQGWKPEVRRGLAVGIEFSSDKIRFSLTGVNTFKEASIANATTTKAVLADLIAPDLPADISESILTTGSFELAK